MNTQPSPDGAALSLETTRPSAALPPPIAHDAVTRIAPTERVVTPCSSVVGLLREACVDEGDVWIGMVSSEPDTASLWHDHGDRTTYVLPLEGEGQVEYEGPDGSERLLLRPDGSLYVIPPRLRHREVNPGLTRMRALLIRLGPKARGETE